MAGGNSRKRSTADIWPSIADGAGYMKFVGTHGYMETDLQLYYEGSFVNELSDDNSHENDFWDYAYIAIGGCAVGTETEPPGCAHELSTKVEVGLGRECGNSITVRSRHRAEERYNGYLVNGTGWESSPGVNRVQGTCEPPPVCDDPNAGFQTGFSAMSASSCEDDGDTGGDGGGGGDSCEVYTCETWFWYDPDTGEVLEVIYSTCYCSS